MTKINGEIDKKMNDKNYKINREILIRTIYYTTFQN